jgi:hypothetical protein
VNRERVEVPAAWTAVQRDGLRSLLEQTRIDVDWDGDAFTCSSRDAEQVRGLLAYLEGKDADRTGDQERPLPSPGRRELVAAGPGLRFVGWLVDTLVLGLLGLGLRLVGVTGWSRFIAFEALVAIDAIVLVAWLGGNLGNLVVGTQVVVAESAEPVGAGRAAIRWAVVRVPAYVVAGLLDAVWFIAIWWIVVYGPILLTQLRQGLHDRAAGAVVITSRHLPEGWTFTNAILGRVRR